MSNGDKKRPGLAGGLYGDSVSVSPRKPLPPARIPTEPYRPWGRTPFKHPKATPQYAQEAINYGSLEADMGISWVDGKSIYKKTLSIGSLPNAGAGNTAHGIKSLNRVMGVTGYATDGTNHYPLPYGSPTANDNIEVAVNATNIVVTTGKDRSGETGYVVLEYTKT